MRLFHLGDVLSVATCRVVSQKHKSGTYEIISYMWGQPCSDILYLSVHAECKLEIIRQYPQFGEIEMAVHLESLDAQIGQVPNGQSELRKSVVFSWLDELVLHFGEYLPVAPVSPKFREYRDVVAEAELITGPGRVIDLSKI